MTIEQPEKQARKKQYVTIFTIFAVVLLVVSGIHLSSIFTSGANSENVPDFIYHLILAAGMFGVARLVKVGKRAVIYLLVFIGVIQVSYSLWMGRGFNPITIIIIATFIWQMVNLSKAGELT